MRCPFLISKTPEQLKLQATHRPKLLLIGLLFKIMCACGRYFLGGWSVGVSLKTLGKLDRHMDSTRRIHVITTLPVTCNIFVKCV